jgi:protein-S-isoprenylcysteine O-methyltransferase
MRNAAPTSLSRLTSKAVHGLLVSAGLLAVPVWLRPAILGELHVWILVLLGVLATALQPSYKAIEGSKTKTDRGTAPQIVWTVYLTMLCALLEATLLRYPGSFRFDLVSILALPFMFGGLALRTWGVLTLGRFFTWSVIVLDGQHLVTGGPYKLIRHPGYAGAWVSYLASTLFVHSWFSAGLTAVLLSVAFLRRIRHEEALLHRTFPQYRAYAAHTKALIPWLL